MPLAALTLAADSLIGKEELRPLLAILKGFRNGIVYGVRIRAPHAFVMQLLFGSTPWKDRLVKIATATSTHAKNLATFVLIYKSLMAALKQMSGRVMSVHAFIAALIGGYYVFGDNNPVNQQINMYLLSRILFGLVRVAAKYNYIPTAQSDPMPIFGAVVWGIVLWLFEHEPQSLQPSLQQSMEYLYHDSNVFTNLRTLLWVNK